MTLLQILQLLFKIERQILIIKLLVLHKLKIIFGLLGLLMLPQTLLPEFFVFKNILHLAFLLWLHQVSFRLLLLFVLSLIVTNSFRIGCSRCCIASLTVLFIKNLIKSVANSLSTSRLASFSSDSLGLVKNNWCSACWTFNFFK